MFMTRAKKKETKRPGPQTSRLVFKCLEMVNLKAGALRLQALSWTCLALQVFELATISLGCLVACVLIRQLARRGMMGLVDRLRLNYPYYSVISISQRLPELRHLHALEECGLLGAP